MRFEKDIVNVFGAPAFVSMHQHARISVNQCASVCISMHQLESVRIWMPQYAQVCISMHQHASARSSMQQWYTVFIEPVYNQS